MPILNTFAKAPRCWPPPRTPEEIGDAVRFPRQRDPIGTGIHAALATLCGFALPLSTAAASVSIALLVGYLFLRLPNAWRGLTPLVRAPAIWIWLAWLGWAVIGVAWTPNLLDWADSLGGFPAILLLPAFFLVGDRWREILGGFVAGVALQGVFQAIQWATPSWSPSWQPRYDGLASHPGLVSTIAAMGALVAAGWFFESHGRAARIALATALFLSLVSITLGAGRGAIVGLVGGVAVGCLAAPVGVGARVALAALAASAFVGLAALAIAGRGPESLRNAWSETMRGSAPDSSIGQRLLWWQASLDAFAERPLVGIGTGATATYFDRSERIARVADAVPDRPRTFFTAPHPHSIYLLTLSEQGLIGSAILLAAIGNSVGSAWRLARTRPLGAGLLGAIVAWWVAAGFESLNLPLRTLAPLMLLLSFVALPRGVGTGLEADGRRA